MATPWIYKKEDDERNKTDPGLLELMKELIKIAKNSLKGESFDNTFGKRSVYLEFKSETRHRLFEFMDIRLSDDEETRRKFLIRGLFVWMMEMGKDGIPFDVPYSIRIPNSPNLVTERTMFENSALSASGFEEVLADIRRSSRIGKEEYAAYVDKAIENIVNRRKK